MLSHLLFIDNKMWMTKESCTEHTLQFFFVEHSWSWMQRIHTSDALFVKFLQLKHSNYINFMTLNQMINLHSSSDGSCLLCAAGC